ncbi:MAG: FHA domain-containing protein [bacterium]|nr:FHA domain-containing protein [bacterium]MDD7722421.1 FHA domain-containing protein [bacterium]MDY4103565.1 FHA domain-containing protein [Parabacteroides sp.]
MKRVFCPKCDRQLTFDETKYPQGKVLAFVCPQCGSQFKIKLGLKVVRNAQGEEQEVKEPDFSCGYISVIENAFAFQQKLPLVLGDNVIGRRNKDTDGVDVPIVTSDPSMGRKHCVIHVKEEADGTLSYTVRDFPSLTGTFVGNELLGKNEQARIEDGTIITLGATTFILHTSNE